MVAGPGPGQQFSEAVPRLSLPAPVTEIAAQRELLLMAGWGGDLLRLGLQRLGCFDGGGVDGRFGAAAQAEFGEDGADVVFDGAHRVVLFGGDFGGGVARQRAVGYMLVAGVECRCS